MITLNYTLTLALKFIEPTFQRKTHTLYIYIYIYICKTRTVEHIFPTPFWKIQIFKSKFRECMANELQKKIKNNALYY